MQNKYSERNNIVGLDEVANYNELEEAQEKK